jgi:type IX secretion system PorP/SprF family membrane protein
VSYDNIGSRSNVSAMGNFAYHLQLNSKSLRLSFGASAGINSNQYDFNGLIVNDNTDINYLTSNKSVSPNFGAGIYLHSNKGYLGFSLPRLIEKSIDNNTSKSFLQRHYYLTSGYVFNVNSVTDIKPSILIKYTQNAPITVDFNYSMFFYNKIWIGLMYRMHESVGFNSSFLVKEAFTLGYSFDYPINNLRLNNFGSHEILFSFDLRSKNRAFISPRYF